MSYTKETQEVCILLCAQQSDRATERHSKRNGNELSVVIEGIGGRWRSVVRGQREERT